MKNPQIELDHIGVAVESLGEASFWRALGWPSESATEVVPDQKVTVQMLPLGNRANIELLEPTGPESTVAKYMAKRGPGIHHICLRVKNIDQVLRSLRDQGIKLINNEPVPGAHGCRVAFVHPSSTGGVLVELSEKAQNAAHEAHR
jgi:methylmalonyl-CoA/ethylmalonyl-CoA epimerase